MNLNPKIEGQKNLYLIIILAIFVTSLFAYLFSITSISPAKQANQVLFALAKIGITIIPPLAWLAMIAIIILWASLLLRCWQSSSV